MQIFAPLLCFMLFSSLGFLFVYLPCALLAYSLTPARGRPLILLLLSLLFYAWGEPRFLPLMLVTILADYAAGLLISHLEHRHRPRAKRVALCATIVANLASLALFKYADLILDAVRAFFPAIPLPTLHLALPIGISFYTFQALSYVIDVYRGDTPAQKSPILFGTYVTLFPQLIAGPIVRYRDVEEALRSPRVRPEEIDLGVRTLICGLAKKVLLANNAGAVWERFRDIPPTRQSVLGAWLGLLFYTFQIYFDFSGYSDMAIGLGRMFGFRFPENFRYPLIARSVSDYWRRWHMTLTDWFRSYVYIPLGGNRRGVARTYRNMLVVWLLTGLWHGAARNFVLWGVFFFLILAMERAGLLRLLARLPATVGHLWTLIVVVFSFYLFAFDGSLPSLDAAHAVAYLRALLGAAPGGFADGTACDALIRNARFLVILALGATPLPRRMAKKLADHRRSRPLLTAAALLTLLLSVAYLVGQAYNPFLYFRF